MSATGLSHPQGVALAADGVYIADRDNRVLFYPGTSTTATRVYGQPDFTSNTANNGGLGARSLSRPYAVAVAPNGLYIADTGNNRVLFYRGTSTIATVVYGQPDYSSNIANLNGVSAKSLNEPRGVAFGPHGLAIADYGNHRVLEYPTPALPALFGDADGNGTVDMADVRAILSVLAGTSGNLSYAAADVSPSTGTQGFGDGLIDMRDAIRLLRHLNGLDAHAPWS